MKDKINFIPYKDRIVILPIDVKVKTKILMPNQEKGFAGLENYEDHPYMGEVIAVSKELEDRFSVGDVLLLDSFDIKRVENININGNIYVVIKDYQVIGTRPDLKDKFTKSVKIKKII